MKVQARRRYVVGISVALVAVVAMSGAVFAYWTTGGAGTGNAGAGTTSDLIVNQTSTIANLYPGASVALAGDFTNPNPGGVRVTGLSAAVTKVTGMDGICAVDNFSITGTAVVPATDVPSGTNVGAWSGLTLNFLNLPVNQDGCKNGTVVITYSIP